MLDGAMFSRLKHVLPGYQLHSACICMIVLALPVLCISLSPILSCLVGIACLSSQDAYVLAHIFQSLGKQGALVGRCWFDVAFKVSVTMMLFMWRMLR